MTTNPAVEMSELNLDDGKSLTDEKDGVSLHLNDKATNNQYKSFKSLDVDEFLEYIGQFGRAQIILCALFCLIIIPPTYQTLVMSFAGNSPPWRCAKNNTECTKNGTFSVNHKFYNARCNMNRSSWEFTRPKSFSIVTEFDLVCEKKTHSYLANSAMFIGWAFGAIILGWVSDRFGRKIVLFPSWTAIILAAFISGFVQNYWLFFALRIWIGVFQGGVALTLFVMASELVGPKYRSLSATSIWFAFTFALCIMGLQAWLIPNWHTLEIIISIPYIIFLATYWYIPESVRWLRVNNKLDKAEKVLALVARRNKKPWPTGVCLSQPHKAHDEQHATFKDLFIPCSMGISTLVQCFAWFVNGMVYYGISLASDNLGGDMYRDFVLTSLVEIPANILVVVGTNKIGRKPTVIYSMIVGGLSCIGVAFVPSRSIVPAYIWSRVALGMLGKLCITLSFNSLYVWSVELYPTVVRSQGMGIVSVVSRCGAASAPWVAQYLGHINEILPFGLMGGLTLLSAISCCILKETRGMATAEVLESSESIELKEDMVKLSNQNLENYPPDENTRL